jgi:hypothetical protein
MQGAWCSKCSVSRSCQSRQCRCHGLPTAAHHRDVRLQGMRVAAAVPAPDYGCRSTRTRLWLPQYPHPMRRLRWDLSAASGHPCRLQWCVILPVPTRMAGQPECLLGPPMCNRRRRAALGARKRPDLQPLRRLVAWRRALSRARRVRCACDAPPREATRLPAPEFQCQR